MRSCCGPRSVLNFQKAAGAFRRGEFLTLSATSLLAACSGGGTSTFNVPSNAMTILTNGRVLTLAQNPSAPSTATGVAIQGGKILAVGSDSYVLAFRGPGAQVIDLQGATLAPGFVESHMHLSAAGGELTSVNLGFATYPTIQGALDVVRAIVGSMPTGKWFFGDQLDPSLQVPYAHPTLQQMDAISTTNPVFIEDATAHLAYANSLAFQIVQQQNPGLTVNTTFPGGGSYGQTNGQFNGVIFELPAMGPFFKNSPPVSVTQLIGAMQGAALKAQKAGCTTIHDPACGLIAGLATDVQFYQAIAESPNTPVLVTTSPILDQLPTVPALMNPTRSAPGAAITYGNAKALWMPGVKLWTDGTPQGETAAMTAPYLNTTSTGTLNYTSAQLQQALSTAKAGGWTVYLHANGDAAIDQALDGVQAVFGSTSSLTGFRTRFEHCTVTRPDQLDRMRSLGITPTFLNNHTYIWGDAFQQRILGNARAQRLDAAGDALSRGMIFSFHCDYDVSQPAPLRYMQTAVTRTTNAGTVLGASLAVSALEALKGVTIYPAMQLGLSDHTGSIEVGKWADFVELGGDPTKVSASSIASIPVNATWRMGNRIPV